MRKDAAGGAQQAYPGHARFFDPRDAESLADQLAQALADPDGQRAMAACARTHAAPFTWERAARRTWEVYLAACTVKGIDAAVMCYGGGVAAGSERLSERQPVDPFDLTEDLSCPLLGLFGKEDRRPSPEHVAKMDAELKRLGKTYEFHSYDDAGHSFFATDRTAYRPAAAVEGWTRVFEWYEKYLR